MPTPARESARGIVLRGIGVSPGVVSGPVYLFTPQAVPVAERKIPPDKVDQEIVRLEDAIIATRQQIRRIQKDLESRTAVGDASLLDAHLMVLDDRVFIEEVLAEVRNEHKAADWAVRDVAGRYATVLASVEDEYLRERVADVRDVARRLILNLHGNHETTLAELARGHVVVAPDLAPSDTAGLGKGAVLGLATDLGSPTSHTAVMARALEIPTVVALREITTRVMDGDEVLIDGNKGVLIIRPTADQLREYGKVAETRRTIQEELLHLVGTPAETRDGRRITLSANVEGLEEIEAVQRYGAEGIGLFRTEYLFLLRGTMVSEDEQVAVYNEVAARLAPAPVIIRTFDLGGDKLFGGGSNYRERNPFLGCRSIRLSLQYPEEFKKQLRAILRASIHGNVKIMYPLISSSREVTLANALLEEAKQELARAGIPFQKDIQVGAMIEVPSAALTAESIARHVSFFSLGTNDLVQYTLAVDRVNERVASLYEPAHPAVLLLIRRTVEAGHTHGIWVGVCGEMAADPVLVPLLIGLGVDELSVAPSAAPVVKGMIRRIMLSQAEDLAELALQCESATEVLRHCRELVRKVAPELLELV
ncbi:MAG: phosphoenolpyruvate--protein phosphotransferase [Kiritimatiellia bacterium]